MQAQNGSKTIKMRQRKEFEKRCKKVLTGERECGIILEHQVRHGRMTSEGR